MAQFRVMYGVYLYCLYYCILVYHLMLKQVKIGLILIKCNHFIAILK